MFTGIVRAIGRIARIVPRGDGVRIAVDTRTGLLRPVDIGDSVAVDGCCLTVVSKNGAILEFDVSAETLRCTAGLDALHEVNLETALRLGDALDGHLVSGHVDGVGVVTRFEPVADAHGSRYLEIETPHALAHFVAGKGSIAVQGVSLTVNGVDGARFHVNLIPHTLAATTLEDLAAGARVNLEVDIVARYVARLASFPG